MGEAARRLGTLTGVETITLPPDKGGRLIYSAPSP
jgi:hypothetical protein